MSGLTPEQQDVVNAPMLPLCVIACAGSGKTKTAVHRLVEMRRSLGEAQGRVALLSFSNVAVDTFRKGYNDLASSLPFSLRLIVPVGAGAALVRLLGAAGGGSLDATCTMNWTGWPGWEGLGEELTASWVDELLTWTVAVLLLAAKFRSPA